MSDSFKPVTPGDPFRFPARLYNELITHPTRISTLERPATKPTRSQPGQYVMVRNDSGSDVARNGVLGIDSPIIDPGDDVGQFRGRVLLSGVTPAAGTHEGKFVVMADAVKDGEIGRAWLDGAAMVQIDVTDANHTHAEIANGDADKLVSGSSGSAVILWKESGTGTLWAVVRLGRVIGVVTDWQVLLMELDTTTYTFTSADRFCFYGIVGGGAGGASGEPFTKITTTPPIPTGGTGGGGGASGAGLYGRLTLGVDYSAGDTISINRGAAGTGGVYTTGNNHAAGTAGGTTELKINSTVIVSASGGNTTSTHAGGTGTSTYSVSGISGTDDHLRYDGVDGGNGTAPTFDHAQVNYRMGMGGKGGVPSLPLLDGSHGRGGNGGNGTNAGTPTNGSNGTIGGGAIAVWRSV